MAGGGMTAEAELEQQLMAAYEEFEMVMLVQRARLVTDL